MGGPQILGPGTPEISADAWREAEKAAAEVLHCIQPTVMSQESRRAVVEYVERLIKDAVGGQVFLIGSVPLETYLPHGDIDLTVLVTSSSELGTAIKLCSVLEVEEQKEAAEYEIRDVNRISAEVNWLVGNDHLFKHSIILIKAWCHYESRILGARNHLIGTYALEIMVLYIINRFHSSLDGPLVVLCRFLDYYNKFDWKNYCISLNGPVAKSSPLKLLAEAPEINGGNLLLSSEFLKSCAEVFSAPSKGEFRKSDLNIIDPLQENNNLGHTLTRASFHRIRSALGFGARCLSQTLLFSSERVAEEIKAFFKTTMEIYQNRVRPDMQVVVQ